MPTLKEVTKAAKKRMESAESAIPSPPPLPDQPPPLPSVEKRAASGAGVYEFFQNVNGRRSFEKGKQYRLEANPFPLSPHICKKVE